MKINSNTVAYTTGNALTNSENLLSKSMEKLSSGFKINRARDNPAGYAISSKMNAQIKGLTKANQNANDGISVIETAEGAISEIQAMLHRMNELAVQSANGTNTTADRLAIQEEVKALTSEITRIATQTEFNTKPLIDGTFELKGYTNNTQVDVEYYSDSTKAGVYENLVINKVGDDYTVTGVALNDICTSPVVTSKGNLITISGADGTEINLRVDETATLPATIDMDLKGIGAMRLQIGANEGQVLELSIPEISLKKMGLENIDISTKPGAKAAIDQITEAVEYSSMVRSKFGAYQNRLEHAITSLEVTSESITSAYSRIMDTDMAEEMTEYTKYQVLQQAGTSMLAQANQFPQQALQLLQ